MDDEHRAMVESLMARCIRCGACDDACPSARHGGCIPSVIMGGGETNLRACICCGRCSDVCPETDPKLVMMALKADLIGAKVPERFHECGYVTTQCGSEMCEGLPEIDDGDDVYVVPGCVAKRRVPFVVYSARRALQLIGKGNRELPGNRCCTHPLVFSLESERSKEEIIRGMGESAEGRDTVTLCGSCTLEFARQGIDFPHICTYLAHHLDALRSLPGAGLRVSVEPGCSTEHYFDDFCAVVRACGCEIVNDTCGCCGKGIPGVQEGLAVERQRESEKADVIVIGCPNCLTAYDRTEGGKPVLYLTELVCLAAGESMTQRYHRIKL
ncbi:MAG: (Fe-S)-binding protein [archaeon]|nr:(Fe-S)-binding protein [archaeon]